MHPPSKEGCLTVCIFYSYSQLYKITFALIKTGYFNVIPFKSLAQYSTFH